MPRKLPLLAWLLLAWLLLLLAIPGVGVHARTVAGERGPLYHNHTLMRLHKGSWARYKLLDRVGSGKFSVVTRGRDQRTGSEVAIKFLVFPVEQNRVLRELNVLRALAGGPNIVQLLDFVEEPRFRHKALVLNFVRQRVAQQSLFELFNDWDIRYFLFETLRALEFVHSQGVVHRDIKPQNIVYDPIRMQLAVCDFGIADFKVENMSMGPHVGTKGFRAPELLLRMQDYDFKADMWSLGATMAGLVFRVYPFFEVRDDNDHFASVVELLGTEELRRFTDKYQLRVRRRQRAELHGREFPVVDLTTLVDEYNHHLVSPDALDLLERLLRFDPQDRPTASEALGHAYFAPIRECWARLPEFDSAFGR